MAMCFAKPSPVSLHAALYPRHGIKKAVLRAPLSLSWEVGVRASGAKGARLVTLVGKGGARKTTAAVLAAQIFHEMELHGVDPASVHTFGAEIDGQLPKAFEAYGIMISKIVKPDRVIFNTLINACSRTGAVQRAFDVLTDMKSEATPVKPDHVTYGALISACARGGEQLGEWEKALEVYEGNRPAGLRPTVSTYNALMTALCEAKQFDQALAVLTDLQDAGMRPNQITCSILLKACEKDGRADMADMALDLYMNARAEGIKPNQVICDCDSILGLCLQKIQSSAVAPQICSSMLPVPADSSNVSPQDKWATWALELFIAKP